MSKILRWVFQVVLVILVLFFGYHYFTREELRGCVTIPVASLNGVSEQVHLDQAAVDQFVENFGDGLSLVVENGENLWHKVSESWSEAGGVVGGEASDAASLAEEMVDRGHYLYCRTVVDRVESGE